MGEFRNNIWIQLGFICLFALNTNIVCGNIPVVKTLNGTLHGTTMPTRLGRNIYAFLGIPYAAPPLGKLRFKPPQPPIAWNGTLDATKNAEICTQRNIYVYQEDIVGSEDCLYLNVYTPCIQCSKDHSNFGHDPERLKRKAFARLPVMIWFHGGGWIAGAGHSEFYGPKFLLDFDLVLVTVNFRLGPLGFLSTEDLECPGNLGLKDQHQAIRWVHENIAYFSGDPNRVTLFGESAGGASVHYHMVSPLSEGLFHRGISQSGNFYNPWTLTSPGFAKMRAITLGKHLGCNSKDSKEFIECLRTKSAEDIIGTDHLFKKFGYCPMIPFGPVIEPKHPGAFLIEDPLISIREGRLLDVPWMTGVTSQEGALKVPGIYGRDSVKELEDNFNKIAPISLFYGERYNITNEDFRNEISNIIRDFYFGYDPIDYSDDSRFKVIDMYSDSWFNHGTYEAVQDFIVNQTSPIFYYYFAYRGSASFSSIFGDPTRDYGVSHADDLQYLFPVGEQLFVHTTLSEKDQEMIDLMTTLWYNFANSGNPTPKITNVISLKWKPVKTNNAPEYLRIENSKKITMDHSLLWQRMIFWDSLTRKMKAHGNSFRHLKDEL